VKECPVREIGGGERKFAGKHELNEGVLGLSMSGCPKDTEDFGGVGKTERLNKNPLKERSQSGHVLTVIEGEGRKGV